MDRLKSDGLHYNDIFDSTLNRKKLIKRLEDGLTSPLNHHFEKIVPAQPWVVYWITHSLALLGQQQFLETITDDVIKFISECAHIDGGYGGGAGQIAHLGTTFAAVNAIITTTSEEALESIDRINLVRFLHRMKQPDGSFSMHDEGEADSRATYCALSILRSLNIQDPILLENVADWILECQTYEGGFGSVPGSEAHGGYTFCCVASLSLLNQLPRANLDTLLRWLVNKQTPDFGGFCGRSNKLVDSCYSYWQGAIFPLIHPYVRDRLLGYKDRGFFDNIVDKGDDLTEHNEQDRYNLRSTCGSSEKSDNDKTKEKRMIANNLFNGWLMDCSVLQDYILNRCQSKSGLLKDKPGAEPDFYHTCYALSGLSISQHQSDDGIFDIGSQQINYLEPTQPIFNLTLPSLNFCLEYFCDRSIQTYDRNNLDESNI